MLSLLTSVFVTVRKVPRENYLHNIEACYEAMICLLLIQIPSEIAAKQLFIHEFTKIILEEPKG